MAHAWPDGVSGNSPDSAASLVPATSSRERYEPLIERISLGNALAQEILGQLARSCGDGAFRLNPWFALWQEHSAQYFDLDAAEAILTGHVRSPSGTRLFLAHSYGKIVLTEFVALVAGETGAGGSVAASLYDWVRCRPSAELRALRRDLRSRIAAVVDPARLGAIECSDALAAIYQEIFPPALRHLLGEYYTPSWLVEYCIDQTQRCCSDVDGPVTILDPAAGSGSFLAHYMARLSATGAAPVHIIGFDVNPLAVDFCRANTQLAAAKAREHGRALHFNVQIRLADAVVDPMLDTVGPRSAAGTFQKRILGWTFQRDDVSEADLGKAVQPFRLPAAMREPFLGVLRQYVSDIFAATRKAEATIVVGNPPWIAWDGLPRRYRDRLAPQWAASTLMVNTGWRAKVAAGKTEFSSLFVYRAAERHAAANAVMVFVLPLSLFQSHLSGAGFRTFRTAGSRHFALVELDDFSSVRVFRDAVNRTAVGAFAVDATQQFPIRYAIWSPSHDGSPDERLKREPSLGGPLVESETSSPIVAFPRGRARLEMAAGRSDYQARGGVNTGGANTIFWLDILAQGDSVIEVRNIGKSLRSSSPVVVAEIEKDAIYPLLRGADMRRWKAEPSKSIFLLYGPDQPKKALPVDIVESRLPKAFAFISRFRERLANRKEYHRWGCSGPFYEVYRIGPYTFSPIKVAWQHTGYRKALNVSVIDDRGRRPAIPDQKVILIPFDDVEEAHYVCAVLSSSVTAALLDRYLGTDASTHILDYVALRKFAPHDEDHRSLAALSIAAHRAAADGAGVAPFEQEIDGIVARLRGVGS